MARKKHEAEKKHALRKKEAPPVQDKPDETEHPALSEKKKPRVSKLLYRIIAALLSSSVVSTDLTTGRQEAACNVPADTKSIAMADESTVYLLGVREIRKENLKVIEADNTLSQTE